MFFAYTLNNSPKEIHLKRTDSMTQPPRSLEAQAKHTDSAENSL